MEEDKKVLVNGSDFVNKIVSKAFTEEDIPEEVYKGYMRSILGNIPFEYTFSLFDGNIKVTFVEVPYGDADNYQQLAERFSTVSDLATLSKLALLVYTKELVIGTNKYKGIKTLKDSWLDNKLDIDVLKKDINAEYIKCFENINESLHRVLPQLWMCFNTLLNFLVNKGLPVSF